MGSTLFQPLFFEFIRDHPHIHGEHSHTQRRSLTWLGSPPYTWGALIKGVQFITIERITPIYMGSTFVSSTNQRLNQDHPHIHGEHIQNFKWFNCLEGSPPYTWGAPVPLRLIQPLPGITPIYMGSTNRPRNSGQLVRDHPHIHGEHLVN